MSISGLGIKTSQPGYPPDMLNDNRICTCGLGWCQTHPDPAAMVEAILKARPAGGPGNGITTAVTDDPAAVIALAAWEDED